MRKYCVYILLFLFLCVACQPTPTEPVVMRKAQSAMLKKAGEPIPADMLSLPLRERLMVPDRLTYAYQRDAMTIDGDAAIVIPEGEMPVVRVFPANFDQAAVSRLWDATVGDVPMTAVQEKRTKEYYAPLIEYVLQALESDDPQQYGFDSREDAQRRLKELQQQYAEAPESQAGAPMDGTLQQGIYRDDEGREITSYTYIKGESAQTGYRFTLRNNGTNTEPIQTTVYDDAGKAMGISLRRVERNAYFTFIKGNEAQAACFVWDRELDLGESCPAEASGSLSIPPQQAIIEAERFLQEAGLSDRYAALRVFLIKDWPEGGAPYTYAYRVVCARMVNGCPTLMAGNLVEESKDQFAPNWRTEQLYVDVNDQGLYCVQLTSPLTVGDTMIERAKLMHFPEIRSIAEKMLPILYETQARSFEEGVRTTYEKHIRRVELGLWCIREMDQLDRGILVPAWAFYANTREVNEDGEEWCSFEPILLLNAVDGSVIDPLVGY